MKPSQLRQLRSTPIPKSGNRIAIACGIVEVQRVDIARSTGLTPQYISDVISGRYRDIRISRAQKFADFFGCLIEDLFPSYCSQEAA